MAMHHDGWGALVSHADTGLYSDRLARLTASERECLRLVARDMSSKDIARALGKSPHTIDSHVKSAMATLQINDRFRAARALRAWEGAVDSGVSSPPQPLASPSLGMAEVPLGLLQTALPRGMGLRGGGEGFDLAEAQTPYFATGQPLGAGHRKWTDFDFDVENRLSAAVRLALIVTIALAAVMTVAALVAVAEGLSRLH